MFNFRQSQTICGFRLPTKEPEIFLNKLLTLTLYTSYLWLSKANIIYGFFYILKIRE